MKKLLLITVAVGLTAALAMSTGNITVKGSDTLVRLGQRWAEEYMKAKPGAVIQVSGGGSGTGIAALLNGSTDVCESSRDMKPKEYELARTNRIEPYRVSVALDGIGVYLHKANPVDTLSLDQLKKIYTGVITNWKEVGGLDKRIILYGRENNSGTYAFFKEHVLNGEDFADVTQTLPGTAAVVHAIANDPNGVGYGGVAWATTIKDAAVKRTADSVGVKPTVETVTSGAYPISRELYWFFRGKPDGDLRALLNWVLSPDGQKIATEVGYIPLPEDLAKRGMIQ